LALGVASYEITYQDYWNNTWSTFFILTDKVLLFFSELPDLCANTPIENIASPDKNWKVILFERDCGATTDFSS